VVPLNESTISLILRHFPHPQVRKNEKSPENRGFFAVIRENPDFSGTFWLVARPNRKTGRPLFLADAP
jgi:hypothetical protein